MRTRAIKAGDLVMIDKRGRVFYARVVEIEAKGGVSVAPLDRRISWRHATAREIVDHWMHTHHGRAEDGQMSLEGSVSH
jgi:hypothetical protein